MPTRGEIAATYDLIADSYDARRPTPWPETMAFEERLPRGARVLDLACGGGRNAVYLRDHGHRVVGLDASSGLLRRTAAKTGTGRLVRGDVVALPFRDASYGAVHSVAAFHHLPSDGDRRQAMREVARVLARGGIAMVSVWSSDAPRFQVEARAEPGGDVYVPWQQPDGRVVQRFYHLFRGDELASLAANVGLAVLESGRQGDNSVVLARRER